MVLMLLLMMLAEEMAGDDVPTVAPKKNAPDQDGPLRMAEDDRPNYPQPDEDRDGRPAGNDGSAPHDTLRGDSPA